MMRLINEEKAHLVIPFAVVSVSFAAIFIRLSDSHPVSIAFYRMLFSTVLLFPFFIKNRKEISNFDRKQWFILITTGLLLAVHFASWISSLSYTSVASSVVLVTAHPLVVYWIAGWHLNEKTSKKGYLAIVIAFVGIIIMAYSDYSFRRWSLFGDLLAIIGMLAVAGYLIRGREMRQRMSVFSYSFLVYLFSTLFLGVFTVFFESPFKIYPTREYLLFIALALIPTMFGHTLYNWALKFVRAKFVSISLLGEPIGSALLAFFILEEVPPQLTIVGAAITLVGIYICTRYD